MSRPGYDTGSPAAPFLYTSDYASTVTSPTNAESERSPRGRSLLAKLHHIFTTKDEPQGAENENKSPPTARQSSRSTSADCNIHLHARSEIDSKAPLVKPSSFGVEQDLKSLHLSGHSGPGRPTTEDVVVNASIEAASALPRQATSWPDERSSPVSTNTKSPLPTVESSSSPLIIAGRLDNVEQQARPVAAPTSTEAQTELPLQTKPLLIETVSSRLYNVEPLAPTTQWGQSTLVAADQQALENIEAAKKSDTETVLSPLTGLPPPSNMAPHVTRDMLSRPVFPGQPRDPADEAISAAVPADTECVQPQLPGSLFAERASLKSIHSGISSRKRPVEANASNSLWSR